MLKSFLIALPTYNEIESIEKMILRIKKLNYDLIVVDGGSTDGTVEKAQSLGIEVFLRGKYGNGYGGGILKAFEIAEERSYKYLGILDCDITYSPEDFEKMVNFIPTYDIIVGARPMKNIALWRRVGNYLHTYSTRLMYGKRIKDVNSGMRIMNVSKFFGHVDSSQFGMVPQISSFALRNNYSYKEVDISYSERAGESKVNILDGAVILWALIKERFKKKLNN